MFLRILLKDSGHIKTNKLIAVSFFLCFVNICLGNHYPLDTAIKKSSIVIEGKVIDMPPVYKAQNGKYYNSYIIQIYKTFKGEVQTKVVELRVESNDRDVWNGGIIIDESGWRNRSIFPSKGQIAMFFVSLDMSANDQTSNQLNNSSTHLVVRTSYDALRYDSPDPYPAVYTENIEKNLYQHIEDLTQQKRKIVFKPELENTAVKDWLMKENKAKLLTANGISTNFVYYEIARDRSSFNLYIDAVSSVGYLDVRKLVVAVRYNTKTFGTYIIKNNRVLLNETKTTRAWWQEEYLPKALRDSSYKTELKDLDSSTIQIIIEAQDVSKRIFQLGKSLIAFLNIKIKSMNGTAEFSFVPEKTTCQYFNYEKRKTAKPNYIFCNKRVDLQTNYWYNAQIKSFSPDTIVCGTDQLLTIRGKNLSSEKTQILIWCTKDACGFYGIIPSSKFTFQSDTLITLKMPCELDVGTNACGSIFPTTSGFVIAKSTYGQDTYSPRKLIVIRPKE